MSASTDNQSAFGAGPGVGAGVAARRKSVVITASSGWRPIDFAEIWKYRHLLFILAARDLKMRYKQTALGVAWAIIQPLVTMLVFTVLFRSLMSGALPSTGDVPYAISTCGSLIVWYLFSTSMFKSSNSLISNASLITKLYFPRLLIPVAPVLSGLVDFLIGFCVVVGLIVYYHFGTVDYTFHFRWALLTLPVFILLALATTLALALWFSALNAIYRDVKYMTPLITQVLMFATPVVYAAEHVTKRLEPWQVTIYGLNPLVGVVEGFRWALLGSGRPPGGLILLSTLGVTVLLIGGLYYFRRMERRFVDLI